MVDDPGMSTAVAAIQTLLEFMNQNAGKMKRRHHISSPAEKSSNRNCPLHIQKILHGGAKILIFIFEW